MIVDGIAFDLAVARDHTGFGLDAVAHGNDFGHVMDHDIGFGLVVVGRGIDFGLAAGRDTALGLVLHHGTEVALGVGQAVAFDLGTGRLDNEAGVRAGVQVLGTAAAAGWEGGPAGFDRTQGELETAFRLVVAAEAAAVVAWQKRQHYKLQ